ncbi:MAG: hypothetical protein ACFFBK_12140, partial [Promethearchaeota archaeon]
MKIIKNKQLMMLFIIISFSLQIHNLFLGNEYNYTQKNESINVNPQAIDRTGKIFSNITYINKGCYINNEFPNLNNQPNVYIPNYNISYANMLIENITALNYTRIIENDFSEFITSSENGPIYVYQKFAVQLSQYINNVSILIQDINDPYSFTDENSWEVAILNCSNDIYGSPNSGEPLDVLTKPHPLVYAAHWEFFDFKNSETGPIYLDIAKTNKTIENGVEKYWFALRIKIPKSDDEAHPKFLYFNPDEGSIDDIGEGEIFATSPDFVFDNYTVNNVVDSKALNGTLLNGDVNSFESVDDDRYLVSGTNNITLDIRYELEELKSSDLTFGELYLWAISLKHRLDWTFNHYLFLFSIDIYIYTNVSNIQNIKSVNLSIYNYKMGPSWFDITEFFDLKQENETLLYYSIRDPESKLGLLYLMNNIGPLAKNDLRFKFEYIGTGGGDFNVSINQFKIEVGELETLKTIQRYDPMIKSLDFPNNLMIFNGDTLLFGNQTVKVLEQTDHETFNAQALTSNISLEFTFNVLNELDPSLWNIDYYDWLVSYPNPVIPIIEVRITSNTTSDPYNLTKAVLQLYKGNTTFDILDETQNKAEWLNISDETQFANRNETTIILPYEAGFTWIFLQLVNQSENNQVRVRLEFVTNSTFDYGFNVSINEFSVNFYIQNAINSDISSSIGLGLNSNSITPSDIRLRNFGIDVIDTGIRSGIWEGEIDDAFLSQGFFEFNITSLWHSIRFDVNGLYEIFKILPIIEFIESPASQYMTGTIFFSVRITEANGHPLENFEIIFEVLNADSVPVYETTAASNEFGVATAPLQFENTGKRFTIRARFAEAGLYAEADVVSGYIRVVDDFILFMDNFIKFLPYIIIGSAAIVSILTYRHIRLTKLRRFWAGEAKILDDLVKISYIMIINKEVGVSIYNKQLSLEGIDSDLISGFLQAVSQFKSEIKKGPETDTKAKGFE